MHFLVRFIVDAESADEANERTRDILDTLVERGEFDWYNDDLGDSRWLNCWKPIRLSSKRGMAIVTQAMAGQFEDFKRTMEIVRYMVTTYSDEQVFNEEFEKHPDYYLSRYQFSIASGYHGNSCQLFDSEGDYITSQKVLNMYTQDTSNTWVVRVDCHN